MRSLYRDAEFVLRQVREPRAYFSILESIAKGNTRIGPIINDTGLDKGVVVKYLRVLIDLHLVEREVPVTEKSPAKSRKGNYRLSDHFFRFWFRFVYPYVQAIEKGRQDWLVDKVIRPRMAEFTGPIFELVAREALQAMDGAGRLPFRLMKLGRWWDKDAEDEVDASQVLRKLQEKAAGTGLRGKPHFCVIARSFKRDAAGTLQLDLKKPEKLLLA